jgi:hypothetical protein
VPSVLRVTRLGVALEAFVQPDTPTALRALDEWIAKAGRPDLVPIWVRGFQLDRALVRGIRERGIEPVLFVEVGGLSVVDDDLIKLVACRAGEGTVVRVNQEGNADWGAPWQRWDAETQIDVFEHISHVMRLEAGARMWYCPQGRQRNRIDELQEYYPGDAAQIVGFDMYSDDEAARFPPDQWMRSVEWCRATGKPVWVGETGRRNGLTRRAEWLRSIPAAGVDAAIVMDMLALRPDGAFDDWRFNQPMRRAFRELVATD